MFQVGKCLASLSLSFGLSLPALAALPTKAKNPAKDLVQTLVDAGQFKTLATALEATQLLGALQTEEQLTTM